MGPVRRIDVERFSPRVVVIASSTGGPEALARLLRSVAVELPWPVLVVQHINEAFVPSLCENLGHATQISVEMAREGALALAGRFYVAPAGRHLRLARTPAGVVMRWRLGPPRNAVCPSADELFESAAAGFPAGVLAMVLTGMGCDGAAGAEAVRQAGGKVFIQDRATSAVWGMPGSVYQRDAYDQIGSPEQAGLLLRQLASPSRELARVRHVDDPSGKGDRDDAQ